MSGKGYMEAKEHLDGKRGSGLQHKKKQRLRAALYPEDTGLDEHIMHRKIQAVAYENRKEYLCTPKFTRGFCELIAEGARASMACEITGLPKRVFYRWLQRAEKGEEPYAEFARELIKALAEFELSLVRRMLDGEIPDRAAKWLLKNVNPDRWSDNPTQARREALQDIVEDPTQKKDDGSKVVVIAMPSNNRDRGDKDEYIDVSP